MQLTIPSPPNSPSDLAITLIAAVYAQYASDLVVSTGSSLSLSSVEGEQTLSTVTKAIVDAAGKASEALGSSDEEKAQVLSWLDKIGSGAFEGEEGLKTLDQELSTRTYLVGNSPTVADQALFASLHPYIRSATHHALLSHPSVTRHFDHLQNSPALSSILARSNVFQPSNIEIDVSNVPLVEIKQEVKVKKPKEGAATAEVAAPAKKEKTAAKVGEVAAPVVEKEAPAEAEKVEPAAGKKEKKEKKGGNGGGGGKKAAAPVVPESPAPWMIELKVGRIVEVSLHPDADSLYVEKIDMGEGEPRTVVSGLVKYVPIEKMLGKTLITVANMKPASMRGIKSFAMVLCASSKEGKDGGVEFVDPPEGSQPGDRVYFEGFEDQTPVDQLNPKKKIFETIQPGFTTLDTKEAVWISDDKKVYKIVTAKGVCTAPTFVGASLS